LFEANVAAEVSPHPAGIDSTLLRALTNQIDVPASHRSSGAGAVSFDLTAVVIPTRRHAISCDARRTVD
jgi:hypothetical protein